MRVFALVVIAFALLIAGSVVYVTYQRAYNVWWGSTSEIKAYLLTQTPVGSREAEVLAWLETRNVSTEVDHFPRKIEGQQIERSYDFPIRGRFIDGMIHEVVAEYGLFTTSVEAFYVFNEGHLVDIGVRTTADGP